MNQAQFDKHYFFPFRKATIVDKYRIDCANNILFQDPAQFKWTTSSYNKLHISNYKRVHYDLISDVMVLQLNTAERTFVRVTQKQFNFDMLDLLKAAAEQHQAHFAGTHHSTLQGLDPAINPDRPPRNLKDAMSCSDRHDWAEALNKEFLWFKDMKALAIVKPPLIRSPDTRKIASSDLAESMPSGSEPK